jgi:hypothetical protein
LREHSVFYVYNAALRSGDAGYHTVQTVLESSEVWRAPSAAVMSANAAVTGSCICTVRQPACKR